MKLPNASKSGTSWGSWEASPSIAPVSGVLAALPARGARIAAGQTLVEIDPSGDTVRCFSVEPEARAIAYRVSAAVRTLPKGAGPTPASRTSNRPTSPVR